jgi:hypothetical protein
MVARVMMVRQVSEIGDALPHKTVRANITQIAAIYAVLFSEIPSNNCTPASSS